MSFFGKKTYFIGLILSGCELCHHEATSWLFELTVLAKKALQQLGHIPIQWAAARNLGMLVRTRLMFYTLHTNFFCSPSLTPRRNWSHFPLFYLHIGPKHKWPLEAYTRQMMMPRFRGTVAQLGEDSHTRLYCGLPFIPFSLSAAMCAGL